MDKEKYLLNRFEAAKTQGFGAKFFKVDLHFHTPASEDARGSNKYNFNPYKRKYPKNDGSREYLEKVAQIQDKILADAQIVAKNMVKRFLEETLSLVAVTDHNSIGTLWTDKESGNRHMDLAAPTWYELIDQEAQKVNKEKGKTLLTIIPGVEISTTGVHILAIFPPQTPRRKIHFMICDLLNEAGFEMDAWGKNPEVGTASVSDTIDLIVRRGGIPIPAHIDGASQALLELHKINSGAMKNVLRHAGLPAVEIVEPSKFTRKDRTLKKPLNRWIDEIRRKEQLPSFAYFQGSDAHDLLSIGKRFTYTKMTEPTFSGLRTAIKMPSSRVRISDLHDKITHGLFVYGMSIENRYFGKQIFRFNRHLNCITGKKGAGKSDICALMQAAVHSGNSVLDGKITLFIEKIVDSESRYYAFFRSHRQAKLELYQIDPETLSVNQIDIDTASDLGLKLKFYHSEIIEEIIRSEEKLNSFLIKYFGTPTQKNIRRFNTIFAIDKFLEKEKEQLLAVENDHGKYRLYLNVNWRSGKKKLQDIFKLGHSMRKTATMCMIIIMSEFGPAIIDAPEADFDNEDIINFLTPVIKKYKDLQQIILFSNNPIFAVNTDPDNYILLNTAGTKLKEITSGFAIDDTHQRPMLLDIVEGSLKSFQKRAVRYDL